MRAHGHFRLLITAGPTHEPVDAVRFLGNRSSGRLGLSLASAAADRGLDVTLLLGPTARQCEDSRVRVERFRTTADLQALLSLRAPDADVLVMAAAVADFQPVVRPADGESAAFDPATDKLPRTGRSLVMELRPTPDLLADCVRRRREGQFFVGFALEPRQRLAESAKAKLERKGVDMVVGNPLETMDSDTIEAILLHRSGEIERPSGRLSKECFAPWLLDRIEEARVRAADAARR